MLDWRRKPLLVAAVLAALLYTLNRPVHPIPAHAVPSQCLALRRPLEPTADFIASRTTHGSDRFVEGTPPVLIRNAKILTGARNGTEVVFGDILLDKGVVLGVGYIPRALTLSLVNLQVIDADGSWVSPGIVDLHSHLAVYSAPALRGARASQRSRSHGLSFSIQARRMATPSRHQFFLGSRSIDGLNTHDDAFRLAVAGGVTTAQILPGSANNIGGQSFLIKPRPTAERSTSAMLLEPPAHPRPQRLRRPSAVAAYEVRMPAAKTLPTRTRRTAWTVRGPSAARTTPLARYVIPRTSSVLVQGAGLWDGKEAFPESLEWEALVDVLRGRVKLSVHCYEAVDLDQLMRLSNEFKFPVASIHHAGETYLVPDLLKKAWGGFPTIALFASNFRYVFEDFIHLHPSGFLKKREAYRGSEFASRILSDNGLPVVMKSDHPVLNSRHLIYEAQQAHYYGLNPALALASVTSTAANALGVGWRIGKLATGFDADLVIWDSHPLALGATPVQVYIDGIPQLEAPALLHKPHPFQDVPRTPSWEDEIRKTIEYEGLPPLEGRTEKGAVLFVNVSRVESKVFSAQRDAEGWEGNWRVLVDAGAIRCVEREGATEENACISPATVAKVVDLKGGELAPGLTTFGSDLGLSEIMLEPSTTDGRVFDPLTMRVPKILGNTIVRAVDGLQFGGRNTLLAYRAGVTTAVVAPMGNGFLQGVGTAFATGASNALAAESEGVNHYTRQEMGEIPLVITVHNADIMATLLVLKSDFEAIHHTSLRLTFAGATEAHLLAAQIGAAGVSVILAPARPYPQTWDYRRILPGPPLSRKTSVTTLLDHGVNVALGVTSDYDARNARFEIAWAALDADGAIDYATAMALATINMERALGLDSASAQEELMILENGSMFNFESKVLGVVSGRRALVDLF
ncbi:Composite domain of metallo-dependent hydrolase [Mycena venus]|uniref:Composite domain of metallo-dependent hydrolase n=1 Tax=Mycena venus TaxID=2733690 RepID=A0A8H6XKU9_9AGAR|nr:Composite domain of metallo-dependent hydrolase [Mycena venus]